MRVFDSRVLCCETETLQCASSPPRYAIQRNGVIISDEPRINDEIRVSQVRLIGPKGEQVGVIATSVALNLAKEANLDLVEVAPNAKPPVAKLIDYGKYKYNEKIKAREARRNQNTAEIKEIRFRLKIDDHDFEVKKGHVVRFLNGGDKVKVTIMLRGREQSRPIGGVELLQRLAADVEEYGTVEYQPKQEGRNIIMTLAPKGKKVHTQSEQRRRGATSRAERQARQAARLAAKQEAQAQAAAEAKSAVAPKAADKVDKTVDSKTGDKASASKTDSKAASASDKTASTAASATSKATTKTSSKKHTNKEGSNAEDEK
ncbi:translation initiation factor IF-3 [Bifidobacterium sp. DSM 109963]|uniref:Translation initiation factor IF-3 n=1 Tax=Bifidobacterium panos TaxID=2675321 RepID=A0ABX1SUD2_9BIFI|nr:translation initiation factor IF-3 [Bifidobacterium sp. DSM 109963]